MAIESQGSALPPPIPAKSSLGLFFGAVSFSNSYREHVEERLAIVTPLRTRAMFGGVGIYSGDLFFALIAEDRLYFKVDDTNRGDFQERGMEPFYPYDSPKPMGYWELPPGVLDDPAELKLWVEKALGVAERAKRPRK
ncbi:MAG: TfoX/Sxy family protein [Fimbriimonadaceae bacterium]|nr:TfoX/Sxy family protein [Fimbriimonadaceae bacterium]QOJ11618.1 MAG: TfoX/Sxy family protein [Chthonomonadaceae bacterium]WKZ81511.1 MAG: TfoX/Sxy family protein [Fimbriimonadaceae bacterium]